MRADGELGSGLTAAALKVGHAVGGGLGRGFRLLQTGCGGDTLVGETLRFGGGGGGGGGALVGETLRFGGGRGGGDVLVGETLRFGGGGGTLVGETLRFGGGGGTLVGETLRLGGGGGTGGGLLLGGDLRGVGLLGRFPLGAGGVFLVGGRGGESEESEEQDGGTQAGEGETQAGEGESRKRNTPSPRGLGP